MANLGDDRPSNNLGAEPRLPACAPEPGALPMRYGPRGRFGAGLLLAAALTALACDGALPAGGARPAGALSRAFINGAELKIAYRFEPQGGKALELFVDTTAVSGDAGDLSVELEPDGFEVVGTPSSWELRVRAGKTETRRAKLRVLGSKTPSVTVVTTRSQGTVEVARETLRFVVEEDGLAECMTDAPDCAEPPTP